AIELEVQRGQIDGQGLEDLRNREATHAVACVDDNPERTDVGYARNQPDEIRRIVAEKVALARPAGLGVRARYARCGEVADLGESALQTDGRGTCPAHLDAVVAGGVVAGGEHRARNTKRSGCEVEEVG